MQEELDSTGYLYRLDCSERRHSARLQLADRGRPDAVIDDSDESMCCFAQPADIEQLLKAHAN